MLLSIWTLQVILCSFSLLMSRQGVGVCLLKSDRWLKKFILLSNLTDFYPRLAKYQTKMLCCGNRTRTSRAVQIPCKTSRAPSWNWVPYFSSWRTWSRSKRRPSRGEEEIETDEVQQDKRTCHTTERKDWKNNLAGKKSLKHKSTFFFFFFFLVLCWDKII